MITPTRKSVRTPSTAVFYYVLPFKLSPTHPSSSPSFVYRPDHQEPMTTTTTSKITATASYDTARNKIGSPETAMPEAAMAIQAGAATTNNCPFHTLPAEIVLDIASAVPFTPSNWLSLRLTCRRFDDVLTHHEGPIATGARKHTFSATSELFPGLEEDSYRNLARLHSRVETLAGVHEQFLKITNNSPELEWLKGRFEGVHKAGLLLLYHLQDLPRKPQGPPSAEPGTAERPQPICTHCQRTHFLRSLPATSLACLLFKLIASVRVLRIYGPEPIKESWKKGDVGARSDVELVCEELILRNGPWFFVALLNAEGKPMEAGRAVGRLQAELESLSYMQSPFHPPTLISILRRALAEKAGCEVREVVSKMWEILSSTGFDDLEGAAEMGKGEGDCKMVKIVRGEELGGGEKGMRRIF